MEFFFIHCKTVKVSQNDQIQMQTWFTSGFLMNGTELRSFSHFPNFDLNHILGPQQKSWKLTNFDVWLSFPVKLWKSVKMIKFEYKHDFQVFSWWMDKWIKNFLVIFKFWPKSHTRTLAENLKIDYFWSFLHSL